MAWLVGSTDINSLQQDLYDLLTGAVAAMQTGGGQAGNGAQVTGDDAWTGLDATNFVIRSKREEDPFSGEYTMRRGIPRFAARTTSTVISDIGQPYFSGAYALGTARVWFALFVSTNNSSPGDLTGTVVTYDVRNADTNASVASGTLTGWTGASDSKAIGATGVSLNLTLTAGQTFVAGANAILWMRGYTTTFTQGIDFFPEAAKVTTAGVTVSDTPGGSADYTGGGTDYTLVQEVHTFPQAVAGGATAPFSAIIDWGGNGCGCGIAWNAAGSPPAAGATYYIPDTYKVYGAYFHIPDLFVLSTNYTLNGGPMDVWDATLQVGRYVLTNATAATAIKVTLNTTESLGRLFTGSGQAGTTFVNFWISVKSDKIVIALRGDPGQSGLLTVMTLQRLTNARSADVWPWVFACSTPDASADGWMAYQVTSKYVYENPYYGSPGTSMSQLGMAMWWYPTAGNAGRFLLTGISDTSVSVNAVTLPDQNPNNWDLRWWIYSIYAYGNQGGSNLVGTFDSSKQSGIRGQLQGVYAVANDNFSSLDELVDNSGTYLLPIPSSRFGSGNNSGQFEALALREE